ncbi:MAG: MBL fold metallo-hydrolase [Deltaproteobacteria bacterium]|nr:MBL fold metallo-hydrolase [Deltaproteobacteria bacterium]
MEVQSFTAQELFSWLIAKEDFLLVDVRNDEEFGRFKVEGPYPFDMVNVPYMEFIEHEEESVAKVPRGKKVRIVCAKEGSSKYVAEILVNHGFDDVAHMLVGIKAWGNLLAPVRVAGGADYELHQFRRPGKASCSYGLVCGEEMMVFDPAKNIAAYTEFAAEKGCNITKTFETHRQADYISGSMGLNKSLGVEIVAPDEDFHPATFAYTPAGDGTVFRFGNGGPEVKSIHTPGHTPGSTCYLIDDRYMITGDTVFIYSIGRPDLGGMAKEWSQMLFDTLQQKILQWDRATLMLPGHYMDWKEANQDLVFTRSLEQIKEINADIYNIADADTFYGFIEANMRKQPDEYAKIREINAGLVTVDDENADIMDLGKNECAASKMANK